MTQGPMGRHRHSNRLVYTPRSGRTGLQQSSGSVSPTSLTAAAPTSFLPEGGPDREPRDLVASFLDRTLDLLPLRSPSLERDSHHVPRQVEINVGDMLQFLQRFFQIAVAMENVLG
jgi:hypothetical protein